MENVFPQVVFAPFGIPIRDSVISTWVMMALVVVAVILARQRSPTVLEMLVGFLNDIISDVMGQSAEPFLPFLGALIHGHPEEGDVGSGWKAPAQTLLLALNGAERSRRVRFPPIAEAGAWTWRVNTAIDKVPREPINSDTFELAARSLALLTYGQIP